MSCMICGKVGAFEVSYESPDVRVGVCKACVYKARKYDSVRAAGVRACERILELTDASRRRAVWYGSSG